MEPRHRAIAEIVLMAAFAEYDVGPEQITALRQRLTQWREEILKR